MLTSQASHNQGRTASKKQGALPRAGAMTEVHAVCEGSAMALRVVLHHLWQLELVESLALRQEAWSAQSVARGAALAFIGTQMIPLVWFTMKAILSGET